MIKRGDCFIHNNNIFLIESFVDKQALCSCIFFNKNNKFFNIKLKDSWRISINSLRGLRKIDSNVFFKIKKIMEVTDNFRKEISDRIKNLNQSNLSLSKATTDNFSMSYLTSDALIQIHKCQIAIYSGDAATNEYRKPVTKYEYYHIVKLIKIAINIINKLIKKSIIFKY